MSAGCHGGSNIAPTLRPAERGRHELQPAAGELDLGLVAAVDEQRAVAPAHVGVQLGEQLERAAAGQAARRGGGCRPRARARIWSQHGAIARSQ